jgi:hypothetical protein
MEEKDKKITFTHKERCYLNNKLFSSNNQIIKTFMNIAEGKEELFNDIVNFDSKYKDNIINNLKEDYINSLEIQAKLFKSNKIKGDILLQYVKNFNLP